MGSLKRFAPLFAGTGIPWLPSLISCVARGLLISVLPRSGSVMTMLKRLSVLSCFLMITSACLSGCSGGSAPDRVGGLWSSRICEGGKDFDTWLRLYADDAGITGRLTIVDPAADVSQERPSFDLVDVTFDGDRLHFVVPFLGTMDEEAVAFELELREEALVGTGRERREGSEIVSVSFFRRE